MIGGDFAVHRLYQLPAATDRENVALTYVPEKLCCIRIMEKAVVP